MYFQDEELLRDLLRLTSSSWLLLSLFWMVQWLKSCNNNKQDQDISPNKSMYDIFLLFFFSSFKLAFSFQLLYSQSLTVFSKHFLNCRTVSSSEFLTKPFIKSTSVSCSPPVFHTQRISPIQSISSLVSLANFFH